MGTGALTINGGSLDCTAAGGIAMTANNPQNWNTSFAFLGTQNLNLGSGSVALANNTTVTVVQNVLTVKGNISGASGLTKAGSGALVVSGNSSYSGGTTVNAGLLVLGNNNSLGTGGLAMVSGTLDLAGNSPTVASLSGALGGLVTNVTNIANQPYQGPATLTVSQSGNTTFGGQIADDYNTVALVKQGNGMLTLTNANAYSGGTTVQAGELQLAAAGALGTAALAVNGGTLDLGGYGATVNSFSGAVGSGVVTNSSGGTATLAVNQSGSTTTYGGQLSDGGGAAKLALAFSGGMLTLSSSNTYSGGTTVSAGTLQLNALNALGSGGLTVNGGLVDLHGNDLTLANNDALPSLRGAGGVITDTSMHGSVVLGVNQAVNTTFAGALVNGSTCAVALKKYGAGTLTLGGSSNYSGGTFVYGGVLQLANANALVPAP